jgi:hypothetical protein
MRVRLAAFAPRIGARVETNWAWRATSFHVIFKLGDEDQKSGYFDSRFVSDAHHYARSASSTMDLTAGWQLVPKARAEGSRAIPP